MVLPLHSARRCVHRHDPTGAVANGLDGSALAPARNGVLRIELHQEAGVDRADDQRVVGTIQRGAVPLDTARVAGAGLVSFSRGELRGHLLDRGHRCAEDHFVGIPVEAGDITVLAADHEHIADVAGPVHHRCSDYVEVLPVFRCRLVPPLQRARVRIQHHHGGREQIGSRAVGLVDVRPGVADRYEQLIVARVHGHGAPDSAAAGLRRFGLLPGLGAGFLAHGNRVETPQLFAGLRVVGHDAPAYARLAAGDPHVDHTLPGERCHRRLFADLPGANDILPDELAGLRIESEQPRVAGATEYHAVHHGDASVRAARALFVRLVCVLPLDVTGSRIDRVRIATGRCVDDAVRDDDARVIAGRAVDGHTANFA